MIRLEKHDEIVEALKERLWSQLLCQFEIDHEECEELAAAILGLKTPHTLPHTSQSETASG